MTDIEDSPPIENEHQDEERKDFILEGNLSGRAARLYKVWSEYYEKSVWENKHFKDLLFLKICGDYFTSKGIKLLYSGRYNTLRVHPFFIQDSGSGKSEAMKAAHFMEKHLGLKGAYLTSTTDASLIGTFIDNRKNPSKPLAVYGMLKNYNYLYWDEGTILLSDSSYSNNLQSIIQMTTDEPGWVEKALRLGVMGFYTETGICAGSYMDDSISSTIFRKGVFQRMLISCKDINSKDVSDFMKNKYRLIMSSNIDKSKDMDSFRQIIEEPLKSNSYHRGNSIYIKFEEESVKETFNQLVNIIDNYELFQKYDVRSKTLNSAFSRGNQILHIAGILSALNGNGTIGINELQIGKSIWMNHIRAINRLLLIHSTGKPINTTVNYRDIMNRILESRKNGIKKNELVLLITDKKLFEVGANNVRKILDRMIEDGILHEKQVKSSKLIMLPKYKKLSETEEPAKTENEQND